MAAPIKAGTADRYRREVEGLSRLETSLSFDADLSDEERGQLIASARTLKEQLTGIVKARVA